MRVVDADFFDNDDIYSDDVHASVLKKNTHEGGHIGSKNQK